MAESSFQKSCPACGKPMVLRTAKRGPHPTQQFYGCSGFPKCRAIVSLESSSSGTAGKRGTESGMRNDRLKNLLRYYIECVRIDEGQPVRASLREAGKRFVPWPLPSDLQCSDDPQLRVPLNRRQFAFVSELEETHYPDLLYGYPTYISAERQVIPLFTWSVRYELRGWELWLNAVPEGLQINPEYLETLSLREGERREILDSLGLLDPTDYLPDIFDILDRIEDMGLLHEVLEPLDPQNLSEVPRSGSNHSAGIHNCAALFATRQPPYTRGLVRELREMVQMDASGWSRTALGSLLRKQKVARREGQVAVEVVPLNEEQREAVRKAATSPLTAVTGPPGTGKSQIVVSMIADAYMRGQRVLFTSKNNKAVDVVEDRVAALAANPIMARTGSARGSRNFPRELAKLLSKLLNSETSASDRREYAALKARRLQLESRATALETELRTIRETNDRLVALDKTKAKFEKAYVPDEWRKLESAIGSPDSRELAKALRLAEKHIADSDMRLDHLLHVELASERLDEALKLVDYRIAGWDIPVGYSSTLRSNFDQLTTAVTLVDKYVSYPNTPVGHFARLRPTSKQLTYALRLAKKYSSSTDTPLGRFSRWYSSGRDRRRIQAIARKAVAACPSLGPRPAGEESFETWREWLTYALAETEALRAAPRDQKRIERIATESVTDCHMLGPPPSGDQTFQAWREWLVRALSDSKRFQGVIEDRKRIHRLASEAAANCSALGPCLDVDQSFLAWRAWIVQALSVAENLRAVDQDRKRIREIATKAVSECLRLSPCPAGDQPFAVWRNWLSQALSVAEALDAIAAYRGVVAEVGALRSRNEVNRELRGVRNRLTDSGADIVALYARLAPDRLKRADRRAIATYIGCLEKLAGGRLGSAYGKVRREMDREFRRVSRHIPAWCVTNLSAGSSLPLKANVFDLLIIDEASQCDIASALPLLYRSKRAILIGDSKQLRHISKIDHRRDQQLQDDYELGADKHTFAFRKNSLFNLTQSLPAFGKSIMLRDHCRSHSHIVGFSNREWYRGLLRICTDHDQLKPPPDGKCGISWTEVCGTAKGSPGGSVSISLEVEAVVEQVVDLLFGQGFDGTLGVVTPFRPQANIIRERIAKRVPRDTRNRAKLIVDTAHGFQGNERDVILFSPCVSQDLPRGAHWFLKDAKDAANLFNVAVTRARSLLHVVGDWDACARSRIPHIERFAEYCAELESESL